MSDKTQFGVTKAKMNIQTNGVSINKYILSAAFIGMTLAMACTVQADATNRPNIILFVVDDMVKEELACYGGKVHTPHIDRLAREGIRFTNGHTVSNVCTPSRYTLFTGRYPGNSYFKPYLEEFPTNVHGRPEFNVGLEDDKMNVGNVLRLSGYTTGHVGKLHVGPELKSTEEFSHNGMYDASAKTGVDPNAPEVIAGWRQNELWYRKWIIDKGFSWAKHVYWGNIKHPYNDHNPEWTLEAALEFIDNNQSKPFYLHYCTTLMHGGSKNWNDDLEHPLTSGAGKLDKIPSGMPARSQIRQEVDQAGFEQSTYGFTWMDASVGAMLNKLEELGIADNTIFVFVSDHGTHGKWSLHEHNGTSIPFVIRWPKVIPAGTVSNSLIQTTDLVPTFFDVAHADIPKDYRIDGTSAQPILADPTTQIQDHLYYELGDARAVRTQDWKYIAIRYSKPRYGQIERASLSKLPGALSYVGGAKNISNHIMRRAHSLESDQLYHISKDPLEMKNLAYDPAHKDQLNKMRGLLTEKLKAQHRPFGEFVPGDDSVPVASIQPHLNRMKALRAIKKGIEEIGGTPGQPKSEPESPETREARQKARRIKKELRENKNTQNKSVDSSMNGTINH